VEIHIQFDIRKEMNTYYVYILASKRNGTLYIGVTNDLIKRIFEHKNDLIEGFTKKYKVHRLVYYEQTEDIRSAIQREKRLKKWNRQWKIKLIEKINPDWKDLYDELAG
jgi:putative endonuclease